MKAEQKLELVQMLRKEQMENERLMQRREAIVWGDMMQKPGIEREEPPERMPRGMSFLVRLFITLFLLSGIFYISEKENIIGSYPYFLNEQQIDALKTNVKEILEKNELYFITK